MEELLNDDAVAFLNGETDKLPDDAQEINVDEVYTNDPENIGVSDDAQEISENKVDINNPRNINAPDNEIVLPISGIKVKMNVKKSNGHRLMQARRESGGGVEQGVFFMAKFCTFDGKEKTAFDILDLDAEDVIALEDFYIKKKNFLISIRKKSSQSQK